MKTEQKKWSDESATNQLRGLTALFIAIAFTYAIYKNVNPKDKRLYQKEILEQLAGSTIDSEIVGKYFK